jgi:Matrixin
VNKAHLQRILDQVESDLNDVGLLESSFTRVRFDYAGEYTEDCLGVFFQLLETGDVNEIYVRPSLTGAALYRVILHEYGHALGLGHAPRGVMAPQPRARSDFMKHDPTPAQRRRWTLEIAQAVMKHRAKAIK